MYKKNHSVVTEFLLLGFQNIESFKMFFFSFLLISYFITLSGNVLLIFLVSTMRTLQSPMYLFISQLSISDILLTTNIVPSSLDIVLADGKVVSFAECIVQFYFFGGIESFECLILTVMAYDRYLAICNPLRYISLMNHVICIKLIAMSWLLGFFGISLDTISISRLNFCGPNVINHFFCDLTPLLELSCSDTFIAKLEATLLCVPLIILPLIIIIISYAYIAITILKISSRVGRWKAFTTCSSHLTVVSIYYGTLICIYVLPNGGQSLTISKVLSLFYTVVTPMLNPVIYSLRNNDITCALEKHIFSIIIRKLRRLS
ncbi:olfactory receptor 5P60-like [Pelobates fuscus]|uniref:olfactory receptor 5P60-like n=1 Tax=Pelobates fuscus TaxID=191477 RepID=UPI002FE4B965